MSLFSTALEAGILKAIVKSPQPAQKRPLKQWREKRERERRERVRPPLSLV
jgi:hypothetical protein